MCGDAPPALAHSAGAAAGAPTGAPHPAVNAWRPVVMIMFVICPFVATLHAIDPAAARHAAPSSSKLRDAAPCFNQTNISTCSASSLCPYGHGGSGQQLGGQLDGEDMRELPALPALPCDARAAACVG